MTESDNEWAPLLKALVDQLVAEGYLRSDEWIQAFGRTPRHVFVPRILVMSGSDYRVLSADEPDQRSEWSSIVYSDDSLVVRVEPHVAGYRLPSGEPLRVPTSSSTMPSLMGRMLEALDVHDGQRVLEVGTGTGYNAALLSHRLGAAQVVSIDVDDELVELARGRLAGLGLRPTLIAGDGRAGAPGHGPFDRIIATAAVPDVPRAWIDQLAPGGKILANIRGELAGGTLCLLTKQDDDEVIGPVLPIGGHFMWARSDQGNLHTTPGSFESSRTTTRFDPPTELIENEGFRFLLQLQITGAQAFSRNQVYDPGRGERAGVIITAVDGSRAEVVVDHESDGAWRVIQTGPRRLWDVVEATERLWDDLGRPTPDRFGIVADRSTQFVWLDNDDGWYRWSLPLM